ncbi:MAG: biopolymer transporter ExbD [Verrucomicrobiota bacterium]|nr:biopolymer transporter ExbD [Verrucomicrobiota bacterium]
MRRFSDRHGLTTLSELNVTPLLDLAFVLLIIFMITTPLMDNSVELVVPSSEAARDAVEPSAVQTVSINRDEVLELNGKPTTVAQLEADLTAIKQGQADVAVMIRAHKELPVQRLIDLMDAVRRANISTVGVVTAPDPD